MMKISVKSQSSSVTTPLPHRYHYVRASSGINKNQTGRTLDVANGYRVVSEQTHEKVTGQHLAAKQTTEFVVWLYLAICHIINYISV